MLQYTYTHQRLERYWTELMGFLMNPKFVSDLAYDRDNALEAMEVLSLKHDLCFTKKQKLLMVKRLLYIVKLYKMGVLNMKGKVVSGVRGIPKELLEATKLPIEVVIEMEIK